ncbi:MAG: DUF6901 family protein [Thermodesulfobacteriota bacterium]
MAELPHTFQYEFRFDDGSTKNFELSLDAQTITVRLPDTGPKPAWTRLEHHQCSCCPLSPSTHPDCPIAVNIAGLVNEFKDAISSDSCLVKVVTPERTYLKQTAIQEGLFSIFGIIMATSNCPVMNFFKPMARFHLPFSTIDETVFRSTSIYLLRQYFEHKKGHTPDLELTKLDDHYARVQEVNHGILKRTEDVAGKDADKNAIIILNALAQMLTVEIGDGLNSLEYLFDS